MKKKVLGGLLVVAIAAVAAFNVNMNTDKNELSLLALANVEALAQAGENGNSVQTGTCYKGKNTTGVGNYYIPCDSKQSSSTMYKCPSLAEGSGYSSDRCLK